jgi:methionine synthase II (cobalamin-independent)
LKSLKQPAVVTWHRPAFELALERECDPGAKAFTFPRATIRARVARPERSKLPAGKVLMPGVISHATNVVEHPDLVSERIVRLAQFVGRENIIAGTDCGFAQGPFYRRVHPSIVWARLEALAEGAPARQQGTLGLAKPLIGQVEILKNPVGCALDHPRLGRPW